MRFLRHLVKKALCRHSSRTMVKTDLVLSQCVCDECGKSIVEPYNGFKALRQYERK